MVSGLKWITSLPVGLLKGEGALFVCIRSPMLCYAKSLQSCPTLSDPMDCSLPGSSVHGIFQARVLEWGAIAFSADRLRWLLCMFWGSAVGLSGAYLE